MSTVPAKNFKSEAEFAKFVELKKQEMRMSNRKEKNFSIDLQNINILGTPLNEKQFEYLISNLVKSDYSYLNSIDLRNNALTTEQLQYLLNHLKYQNANITNVRLSDDIIIPISQNLLEPTNTLNQIHEKKSKILAEMKPLKKEILKILEALKKIIKQEDFPDLFRLLNANPEQYNFGQIWKEIQLAGQNNDKINDVIEKIRELKLPISKEQKQKGEKPKTILGALIDKEKELEENLKKEQKWLKQYSPNKKLIQAIRNTVDQNQENQDRLYEEQRKSQVKSLGQSSPQLEKRFSEILKEPRGKMEEPAKKEGFFARFFSAFRSAIASILPKKTATKAAQTTNVNPKTQTTAQTTTQKPITTEPPKVEEPKPTTESFSPDKPLIFSQTQKDSTEPLWKHQNSRDYESSYEPGFEVTTTETNPIETLQNKIDTLLRDRRNELNNIHAMPFNVRETRHLATRVMTTVHTQMNMLKEMKSILEKIDTQSPEDTQKALDSFKRKYTDIPSIDQNPANPVHVELVNASQEFEKEVTKYLNQITPSPSRPRM